MGRNFEEENSITIIITTIAAAIIIMTIPIANEKTISAAITRILMIDKIIMILGREEDPFLANKTMPTTTLARVVHPLHLRNDPV